MAYWIINTAIITGIIFLFTKIIIPRANSKKALEILEEILFPNGESQKNKVIETFRRITKRQLTKNEMLDYFIKEKGIQLISIDTDFSDSVKKYLMKPSLVELDYFEKVKFHEAFINYQVNLEALKSNGKIENSDTVFEIMPKIKTPAFLAKKGYAS